MSYITSLTSPVISTQSCASVDTAGFPNVQLVKLTEAWSLQSNSPSVLMSLNPIQSSSFDAADSENEFDRRMIFRNHLTEVLGRLKQQCTQYTKKDRKIMAMLVILCFFAYQIQGEK